MTMAAPAGSFVNNIAFVLTGATANLSVAAGAGVLVNDNPTVISNRIVDAAGNPLVDVLATIRPLPAEAVRLADGSEVAPITVATDPSGTWYAKLEQTANMTPGTLYVVDEGIPGDPRQWEFFVDAIPGTLYQHLSNPPIHQVVPGPPLNVIVADASGIGPGDALVTWSSPAFNGNTPILTYTITGIDATTLTVSASAALQSGGTYAAILTGVAAQLAWSATVHATNGIGSGPESLQSNQTIIGSPPTPVTQSGAPAGLALNALAGSIGNGTAIDTHLFGPTVNIPIVALVGTFPGSITAATANLQMGAWPGTISNPVSGSVPSAPTNVIGVAGINADVVVSWLASGTNGGSAITKYDVAPQPGGSTVSAGLALSKDMTGLIEGVAYQFAVAATNANGDSVMSVPSAAVVAQRPPGPPTGVTATLIPSFVRLSWVPPANLHGSVPTQYNFTINPSPGGGSGGTAYGQNSVQIPLSILTTVGATYSWTMTLSSSAGNSSVSVASNTITVPPPTLPNAPTQPTAAGAGSGQILVTWHAPNRDGGSAITGYKIVTSGGGPTVSVGSATFQTTISGLANGTAYTFSIYAFTNVGASPAAVTNAATSPGNTNTALGPLTAASMTLAALGWQVVKLAVNDRALFGVPAAMFFAAVAGSYAVTVPGVDPGVEMAANPGALLNGVSIGPASPANLAVTAPVGQLSNAGSGATTILGVFTGLTLTSPAGVRGQGMLGTVAAATLAAPAGTLVNPAGGATTIIGSTVNLALGGPQGLVGVLQVGQTASLSLFAPSGTVNSGSLGRSVRRALFAEEGGGQLSTSDYQNHEIVVMQPNEGDPVSADAANPTLLVYQYTTGVHKTAIDVVGQNGFNPDQPPQPNNPQSWWLYDINGNQLCRKSPNQSILHMNPRSTGWRNYYAGKVQAMVSDDPSANWISGSSAWDGPYMDTLGSAVLGDCATVANPTVHAQPTFLDPVSGVRTAYTNDTWYADAAAMAGFVYNNLPGASQNGGRDIIGNGLGNVGAFGGTVAGTGSKLLYGQPLFTMLAEDYLRGATDVVTAFPSRATIVSAIQEIQYITVTLGCNFIADCKVWVTTTQTQSNQWARIFLATILLGHNGYESSAFAYEVGSGADRTVYPYFTVQMGDPTAAPVVPGSGTISRVYAGGIVLYSPGSAGTWTLSASNTWTDVDGTVYSGAITVPADFPLVLTASTPAVSADAIVTGGTAKTVSPWALGVNGESWRAGSERDDWKTSNPGFSNVVKTLNLGYIRSPGGTTANYYDWFSGLFVMTGSANEGITAGGPGVGDAFTMTGTNSWASFNLLVGSEPEIQLNMCSLTAANAQTVDGNGTSPARFVRVNGNTNAANDAQFVADITQLVSDQMSMLDTMVTYMRGHGGGATWYPKIIELGNELYLNAAQFVSAFQTYGPHPNYYVYACKAMLGLIPGVSGIRQKSWGASTQVAMCGLLKKDDHNARWQSVVTADTTLNNGDGTHRGIDAFTFHGMYYSDALAATSAANYYTVVGGVLNNYATNNVFAPGAETSADNHTQLPAGKLVGYTEYNLNTSTPFIGQWAHAMTLVPIALTTVLDPVQLFGGPHALNAPDSTSANLVQPSGALQPVGIGMSLLYTAASGSTAVQPMTFTYTPGIATTQAANVPTLMGAIWTGGTTTNALIINFDNVDHTVGLPAPFKSGTPTVTVGQSTQTTDATKLQDTSITTSAGTISNVGVVDCPPFSIVLVQR